VTVREWIIRRTPAPPASLTERLLTVLGPDADSDESRTAEICLTAAARALDALLSGGRFARDSALELLVIDALTTYAYEHASLQPNSGAALEALAHRGTQLLGQLMTQRV
jgi:hypothetical protein